MPARHISSQSFDEILSDLGDDPAIPDPHGIRKPPSQQSAPPKPPRRGNQRPFSEPYTKLQIPDSIQKIGVLIPVFIGLLIVAAASIFILYNVLDQHIQSAQEESQKLIFALKKEVALMRDEIHYDQNDLYNAMDEIEVSVHSLLNKRSENRVSERPKATSHKTELARWRYLGAAQMGDSHQAFFNTGKSNRAFEKGARVIGEWRLSNIENGSAVLTHPEGKSLVLKAFSSE